MPSTSFIASSSRHKTGVVLGLLGFAAGVIAFVASIPALALAAGLAALVAPALAMSKPAASNAEAPVKQEHIAATPERAVAERSPFHEIEGLLTADFFEVAVQTRITAARRFLKPLSVVRLKVVATEGQRSKEADVAKAIISELRDCDTAYALEADTIGIVLEDTPENGAIWAVERIRRGLAVDFPSVRVWAGVACYPAHAMEATEVMAQASEALERAEEWPQDRIEVAFAD